MSGDDEQPTGIAERIALPPPIKRRDYHLRMCGRVGFAEKSNRDFLSASISIMQSAFGMNEDLPSVSVFGVDLNLDSEAKHR